MLQFSFAMATNGAGNLIKISLSIRVRVPA